MLYLTAAVALQRLSPIAPYNVHNCTACTSLWLWYFCCLLHSQWSTCWLQRPQMTMCIFHPELHLLLRCTFLSPCFCPLLSNVQLVEHVLAAAPPDDHVLNMLLLVLKPANKMPALLPAYEAACSKAPGDEELMQGLFGCHVRWGQITLLMTRSSA